MATIHALFALQQSNENPTINQKHQKGQAFVQNSPPSKTLCRQTYRFLCATYRFRVERPFQARTSCFLTLFLAVFPLERSLAEEYRVRMTGTGKGKEQRYLFHQSMLPIMRTFLNEHKIFTFPKCFVPLSFVTKNRPIRRGTVSRPPSATTEPPSSCPTHPITCI